MTVVEFHSVARNAWGSVKYVVLYLVGVVKNEVTVAETCSIMALNLWNLSKKCSTGALRVLTYVYIHF